MAKKSKKPSAFQAAQKELKRIERMQKRVEARSYTFKMPGKYIGLTREGKKKTRYTWKEVEELKKVKTKDLYKHATFTTPSGKTMSGEEGRKWERRKAGRKGYLSRKQREYEESQSVVADAMIESFRKESNYVFRKKYKTVYPKAMAWLDEMLAKYDRITVGLTLARNPALVKIVYLSYDDDIDMNLSAMADKFNSDLPEELESDDGEEDFRGYDTDDVPDAFL